MEEMNQPEGAPLPDFYQEIGVDPSATRVEIKEAYLRLKNTYSQGSAALYSLISEDEAKATMARIEEAYAVLDDDYQRQEYDKKRNSDLGGDLSDSSGEFLMDSVDPGRGLAGDDRRVVMTSRSTLPVIKTMAGGVNDNFLQDKFQAMIDAADPGDGDLYRQLRELAGVDREEIQSRTKISREYLLAIESNRFEQLPQAVFVKGFLRSYFRYLAIPQFENLVEAFAGRLVAWQTEQKN